MSDELFYMIKETAQTASHAYHPMPAPLNKVINVFEKVHIYWWAFKDYKLFKKMEKNGEIDTGHPMVYGAALHLLSDFSNTIDYSVKLGLVAKCIDDLIDHHFRVYQAFIKLDNALHRKYPIYQQTHRWRKIDSKKILKLSPFMRRRLKRHLIRFLKQAVKVMHCVARLFAEIFKLTMCERDVYLIATCNSQARFRACTELAASIMKYQNRLANDKDFLRQEITKRQALINGILTKMGIEKKVDWFLDIIKDVAEEVPEGIRVVQNVAKPFFISGKMTPIDIPVEVLDISFRLPKKGRHPPWVGQHLKERKQFNSLPAYLKSTPKQTLLRRNSFRLVREKSNQIVQGWFKEKALKTSKNLVNFFQI